MVKKSKNIEKICFLITPIGASGSEIRKRVDQWNRLIYKKALGKKYKIVRADQIDSPGIITRQIIELIVKSDLVMIDYTDLNENVMYESAIRHMVEKPYIQISPSGQRFPFDIKDMRNIVYDPLDLEYPKELVKRIKTILGEIEDPKYQPPKVLPQKIDLEKSLEVAIADPDEFVSLLLDRLQPVIDNSRRVSVFKDVGVFSPSKSSMGGGSIFSKSNYGAANPSLSGDYGVSWGEVTNCPFCGSNEIGESFSYLGTKKTYFCKYCGRSFSDEG
jgi:hypothetical protein